MPELDARSRSQDGRRFFLGGQDLEMAEIADLLREAGAGDRIVDKHLAWGAVASAYRPEIEAAIKAGETPVLIELAFDLPPHIDRAALIEIDHHGLRAGQGRPSSLRQVFDLLRADGSPVEWTRRRALVEANDIGHAQGMRAIGADVGEIRAIRDGDRAAQGVTAENEALSRGAIADARHEGLLFVVETEAPTASAVMDFLLPEYGGSASEVANTLVLMPHTAAFFGDGAVIERLKVIPDCWYGGALPEAGFWGAPRSRIGDAAAFSTWLATVVTEKATRKV